jgi:hypothetical protein
MSWEVHVLGECNPDRGWEISVVKKDNKHGHDSYGWFGEDKIMVGECGYPCSRAVAKYLWEQQMNIAHELTTLLNKGILKSS